MSRIYLHYTDKTLILDSSENLSYPLLGSLLRWNNLRVAFAFSLTQSTIDDNAGFANTESLPIVGNVPLLNRVSIGLKSKGLELPGDVGCSFAGFSNAGSTNGSSLGVVDNTVVLSTRDTYSFNVNLFPSTGYVLTSTPQIVPLSAPFNNSGSLYSLPIDQIINFNGVSAQLTSPLNNGETQVYLKAEPPVNILPNNWFGSAKSDLVFPDVSLGCSIDGTYNYTHQTGNASQTLFFPPSFVMQSANNYATVVILDFVVGNRGQTSQTMKVGYEVIPFVTDTSSDSLSEKMASYSPTFESIAQPFNTAMPTCLFVRWPFNTTRLRIHSLGAKRF